MRRAGLFAIGAAILLGAGAAAWLWFGRSAPVQPGGQATDKDHQPTLYCEFTNFADRTPSGVFYFLIEGGRTPPVYMLIFQRKKDGSQSGSSDADAPRPEWRFDASENPAVLHSPDDAIAINLYDYDANKRGITWFEASLRSNTDKNLGGKCRRSAT